MALPKKKSRGSTDYVWSKEKIAELIQLYESHVDLWNVTSEQYRNRAHKLKLQSKIAAILEVDVKDVAGKIHNLRCQYNAEMRKIKQKKSGAGSDEVHVPRWEYFHALNFLSSTNQSTKTISNLDTTDSTENEENSLMSDGTESADLREVTIVQSGSLRKKKVEPKQNLQKEALMNNAIRILSNTADSYQIFGDYVADQMRGMSESQCKRLKISIQKAIVELQEEPDEIIILPELQEEPDEIITLLPTPSASSTLLHASNEQYSQGLFDIQYKEINLNN